MANDPEVPQTSTQSSKKRKPNHSQGAKVIADVTLRSFEWYYHHITLVNAQLQAKDSQIDALTVKKYFTAAMTQRFGVWGSAVPMDLLKMEGVDAWIRIPFEDRAMVTEALSGWVGNGLGWRIRESGAWLGGMIGSSGRDLFED